MLGTKMLLPMSMEQVMRSRVSSANGNVCPPPKTDLTFEPYNQRKQTLSSL